MVPIRYNVRSLLVRRITSLATAGGIALVVVVFAGALMLQAGIERVLAIGGRSDVAIVMRKGSDSELASTIRGELVSLLRAQPQVAQNNGSVGELVTIVTGDKIDGSGISNVLIRGMPADGIAFRPEFKIVEGRPPKPGTNEVVVGKAITGRFVNIEPGKSFEVRRNRPLNVVGVFTTEGSSYESEVWGDLDEIRRYLGREGNVSSARVRLNSANDFDAYRSVIENDKQFTVPVKVMRETDYYAKASEETAKFLMTLGMILAVLFSIAAMIGAAITMNGAVAHRSREIGTLRALGFSRFAILLSFVFEALALALLGGLIGCLVAGLLSMVSFPVLNMQTFSEIVIRFEPDPSVFVTALIFACVLGLLGGLWPAIRASQVSPVEAMRA